MEKNWKKELEYSRSRIGGSTIENLDFETLIEKYKPKENDFWYLDPPYFIATDRGDYYMNGFTNEDHLRLKECVDTIDKNNAKFMISYDYREEVEELYSNYNIKTIKMKYAGATKKARDIQRKEYVIMNYEPTTQFQLFKED